MQVLNEASGENWHLYNGDCVEVVSELPDESIGFSVFSPPFSSLYVYSDSENDMGNCETDDEFFEHFGFLVKQLFRVLQSGRCISVHCMNLPSTMQHNGYIGIRDFRGDVIRCFQSYGFVYHSEVCIWKDPVTAMQRTKALGLLHKQVVKDSCRSRQGIPDYVCTFRKPGVNANPVEGGFEYFAGDEDTFQNTGTLSIDVWQRYASPVWMDIRQTRTLSYREARGDDDTRHLCPLQLDVIERCLQLWSKPNDIVLSPFAGVGSEGWESVRLGRRFIGVELKPEYFECAAKNLGRITAKVETPSLFDQLECAESD